MKSRSVRSGLGVCASLLMLFSLPALGQVAVTTYHNDNYRSGANTQETTLTPSNVNEVQFGKRLVLPVEGYVYAQPLYVPHVSIGGISHNVVYVATEPDQVYAFDANTGQPALAKGFIGDFGIRQIEPVSSSDDLGCGDLVPEVGITSTPVIDLTSQQLYLVAKTKEVMNGNATYYQRMHVLDIRTGVENLTDLYFGAPIRAKTPGTGSGSVDGYLAFDPCCRTSAPRWRCPTGLCS
jgi:hypothetical protein